MGVMLDIAGALFVRSAIIVVMFTVTTALNDALYFKTAHRTIRGELANTVEILESDFARMGYNVTLGYIVLQAETSSVRYLADLNDDGNPDTVSYYLGGTEELNSTPNPRDRFLYRSVSGQQPLAIGQGITRFFLRYYTSGGVETSDPTVVSMIHVQLCIEHGTFTVGEIYPEVKWQRRIFPVNL
jgi:hypothetical protein